jgi:hypothetical protein
MKVMMATAMKTTAAEPKVPDSLKAENKHMILKMS